MLDYPKIVKGLEALSHKKKNLETEQFPLENIFQFNCADVAPSKYSVLAVDGSQIYPDWHMPGGGCALINIGGIALNYGKTSSAKLFSEPEVLPGDDDLTPEIIDLMREEREIAFAFEKWNLLEHGNAVALLDGSMTFSHLASKSELIREKFLKKYLLQLERFYEKKRPITAYTSMARPQDAGLPAMAHSEAVALKAGMTRSEGVSISPAKGPLLNYFPSHLRPHFFYLNVGSEIARVEIPQWVAESENLLELVCQVCCDQVRKGRGYPVSLAEAHARAVVSASDRKFFYRCVDGRKVGGNSQISKKLERKKILFF